jgi:hypothetical protein
MKNNIKNWRWYVQLLLEQLLVQCWQPVASIKALDPLLRTMQAVLHQRIVMAIGIASKFYVFFIVVVFPVTLVAARAIWSE